ncbi:MULTISPECIES: ferredoxin-type protein NapF [Vibrio]|uniref:Ferredoxin-type protein NapF n=1 Tax=Vibrio proteolyticus NBRC 13287 TaxID=1219065 RepID=U2ZI63_VIBPR|nr:ferredoxin-type protein NapF [Vibrio proteolyticus]NAX21952.1 ferredoxin-type protein NapF [Vibrio sp. V39_P1S14PM300]GAD67336.1 iron-sulfur protein NapF [Vibrio proteolyticus NBRC 13287]
MVDLSKRRFFSRRDINEQTLRLPWLIDNQVFVDGCTRCGKCVSACETQIIKIGDGGYPSVDFTFGECTFCYQCAEACPEPLFNAKDVQPWNAKATITEQCLAKQNVDCRSCGDLCDPMAIKFKPEIGRVSQPILDLSECNGCGACVSVCPTSAINVSNIL